MDKSGRFDQMLSAIETVPWPDMVFDRQFQRCPPQSGSSKHRDLCEYEMKSRLFHARHRLRRRLICDFKFVWKIHSEKYFFFEDSKSYSWLGKVPISWFIFLPTQNLQNEIRISNFEICLSNHWTWWWQCHHACNMWQMSESNVYQWLFQHKDYIPINSFHKTSRCNEFVKKITFFLWNIPENQSDIDQMFEK